MGLRRIGPNAKPNAGWGVEMGWPTKDEINLDALITIAELCARNTGNIARTRLCVGNGVSTQALRALEKQQLIFLDCFAYTYGGFSITMKGWDVLHALAKGEI